MSTTEQPEPASPEAMAESIAAMSKAISDIEGGGTGEARILNQDGTISAATISDGGKPNIASNPRTAEILAKVLPFLDRNTIGPIFTGVVRSKVFVGFYPRHQQLLDVEMLTGVHAGEIPTAYAIKMSMIGELVKCLQGWVPENSPRAALLRANIHNPKEWGKLEPIAWLETRDPYIFEAEVEPLFTQYAKWRREVQPTQDDLDFYYSLLQ